MIQANELRLGNYLYDDTNRYFQVKLIGKKCLHSYGGFIYDLDDVNPIPLTEEVLLKCGFKFSHFYGDERVFLNGSITLSINAYNYNIIKFREFNLKYLHQLQNLIYALTNQELNIEL